MFTGDEFADGGNEISNTLREANIKASFFLTGNFYRNKDFERIIKRLKQEGHYLGPHSDQHLLYCDWSKRDSLLVTKEQFTTDLNNNYNELKRFGIKRSKASYFLPPYEWYNDSIAGWTKESGLTLVNYTPGTLSHADYTTPDERNYRSSELIYNSIMNYEQKAASGVNGFLLLMHIGTDAKRTDKFYHRLPDLIDYLKGKGYKLVTVPELLEN